MPRTTTRQKAVAVPFIAPQLATLVDSAPTGRAWLLETKFDGYRMQCHVLNGHATLYSRNALDWTHRFPAIAADIEATLGNAQVVLDGEVVVNTKGRSSFHALQSALSDKTTAKAVFMVFDLLYAEGVDVRQRALVERRELLAAIFEHVPTKSHVRFSKPLRGTAAAALTKACARGDEGIICKRKDARYETGRGNSWLKVKCGRRQEFVIVGYSEPKGSRQGVGSLLLGVYDQKHLQYAGRVGSGFDTDDLIEIRRALGAITVAKSPLSEQIDLATVREAGKVTWVKPKLVAEVSFTEWTSDGLLRHPVFQGLREDKKPTDIKREGV
jgi:bifunctional non-homologous end joining protein LigD